MVPGYHIQGFPGLLKHHTYIELGISSEKFDHMNMKLSIIGGGGATRFFRSRLRQNQLSYRGISGKSFSPISPSLITLGHMLIHNLYIINGLFAHILVYWNKYVGPSASWNKRTKYKDVILFDKPGASDQKLDFVKYLSS